MTRPRSSLDRVVLKSPTDEATIRAMAVEAWKAGLILFMRKDLDEMPDWHRAVIESEARRIYGAQR